MLTRLTIKKNGALKKFRGFFFSPKTFWNGLAVPLIMDHYLELNTVVYFHE